MIKYVSFDCNYHLLNFLDKYKSVESFQNMLFDTEKVHGKLTCCINVKDECLSLSDSFSILEMLMMSSSDKEC
jgi:hypothetical protein